MGTARARLIGEIAADHHWNHGQRSLTSVKLVEKRERITEPGRSTKIRAAMYVKSAVVQMVHEMASEVGLRWQAIARRSRPLAGKRIAGEDAKDLLLMRRDIAVKIADHNDAIRI